MKLTIEIPDSLEHLVAAKTEAELAYLLQQALLQPTLQSAVKGLQVDSLISLDYLTRCMASLEELSAKVDKGLTTRVVTQAPMVVPVENSYQEGLPTATVDLSCLAEFNADTNEDEDADESPASFSALRNFMMKG